MARVIPVHAHLEVSFWMGNPQPGSLHLTALESFDGPKGFHFSEGDLVVKFHGADGFGIHRMHDWLKDNRAIKLQSANFHVPGLQE